LLYKIYAATIYMNNAVLTGWNVRRLEWILRLTGYGQGYG